MVKPVFAWGFSMRVGSKPNSFDAAPTATPRVPNAPTKVSVALTRGANVNLAQIERLSRDGFRSIISLNLEGDDDAEHAAHWGLRARSLPVLDQWHPTMTQIKTFLETVQSAENQPAYVHCTYGNGRTSVFVACYRLAVDHWSLGRALTEAKSFGHLSSEQQAFIEQFSAQLAS